MLSTINSKAEIKATLSPVSMTPQQAVQSLVDFFHGQKKLAEELGVRQQTVGKWVNGLLKVSPARAIQLEKLARLRGLYDITRQKLRPDFEW